MPDWNDIVGLNEIADRLGVQKNTPDTWRGRGLLPEPAVVVSGTPLWEWSTILDWARRTRRV